MEIRISVSKTKWFSFRCSTSYFCVFFLFIWITTLMGIHYYDNKLYRHWIYYTVSNDMCFNRLQLSPRSCHYYLANGFHAIIQLTRHQIKYCLSFEYLFVIHPHRLNQLPIWNLMKVHVFPYQQLTNIPNWTSRQQQNWIHIQRKPTETKKCNSIPMKHALYTHSCIFSIPLFYYTITSLVSYRIIFLRILFNIDRCMGVCARERLLLTNSRPQR